MNGFKPNVKMSMKKAMGGTVQARPKGSSPRPGEKPFSPGMSRPGTNMPLVKNPPSFKPMGKPMGKPGVKMAMGGNAAKPTTLKPYKLRPGEVTNRPPRFDGVGDGPRRPPKGGGGTMGSPVKPKGGMMGNGPMGPRKPMGPRLPDLPQKVSDPARGPFGPRNPNGPRKPMPGMSGGAGAALSSLFTGPMPRKKGGMAKGKK